MKKKSLLAMLCLLTGCSAAKVEDYADKKPVMDVRKYFDGEIEAWGVYKDRSGMVTSQFYVTMKGSWNGNEGKLEEEFTFDDGKKDQRVWTIKMKDDHYFTGTAHDVVGEAQGGQFGNAVNMRYVLRVPVKDTTYDISMDDWMYMVNDTTVLNHITMRKFGIRVGELLLTFKKK